MSATVGVMRAAEAAQDAAMERCKAEKLAVYEYPFGSGRAKEVLDEEIARAILAERERCAGIVDASIVSLGGCSIDYAGPGIATAIRSGEES